MKIKQILFATILIVASAAFVSAQRPVKFTSVYTRLDGKGCKTLRGGAGRDAVQGYWRMGRRSLLFRGHDADRR